MCVLNQYFYWWIVDFNCWYCTFIRVIIWWFYYHGSVTCIPLRHSSVSLNKFVKFILKSLPSSPLTKNFSNGVSAGIVVTFWSEPTGFLDIKNLTTTGISSIARCCEIVTKSSHFLISIYVRELSSSLKTNVVLIGSISINPVKVTTPVSFIPFAYTFFTGLMKISTNLGLKFPKKIRRKSKTRNVLVQNSKIYLILWYFSTFQYFLTFEVAIISIDTKCKRCKLFIVSSQLSLSTWTSFDFIKRYRVCLKASHPVQQKLKLVNPFMTGAVIILKPVHWFAEQINGLASIW